MHDWLYEILLTDCDLVYQDIKGNYVLYRIREKRMNEEELKKIFGYTQVSHLKNGSFEEWSTGPVVMPDYFKIRNNTSEVHVSREEKDVYIGECAIKIKGDGQAERVPQHPSAF